MKLFKRMWQQALRDGTVERIGIASGKRWDESSRGIMPVSPYMICGLPIWGKLSAIRNGKYICG
ncbi:hypothetical protein ADS79_05385 [Brevibacillus reuszeri]|uniref:Uncharacterized protein n=1 Tax=Brevibacillus reuszeri TaxID=54915 RepID=A0A0K9YXE2_9BACL|nr:hypothetical protein ADS79_05385 [Brevibacillus reuszeri]